MGFFDGLSNSLQETTNKIQKETKMKKTIADNKQITDLENEIITISEINVDSTKLVKLAQPVDIFLKKEVVDYKYAVTVSNLGLGHK